MGIRKKSRNGLGVAFVGYPARRILALPCWAELASMGQTILAVSEPRVSS
jgi:hypothetical protein